MQVRVRISTACNVWPYENHIFSSHMVVLAVLHFDPPSSPVFADVSSIPYPLFTDHRAAAYQSVSLLPYAVFPGNGMGLSAGIQLRFDIAA